MKVTLSNKCPNCGSNEKKRLMGMGFWQTLLGSKKYECEDCQTDYLLFFGFINFLLLYGQFVKKRRKKKFLVIASRILKFGLAVFIAYFFFHNAERIQRRVMRFVRGSHDNEMQYFIERTRERTLTTTTDPEIKHKILELYRKAENQIIEKKLMLPKGDNAWETYNEILKIDPNWNQHAIEGLRLVKEEEKRRHREDDITEQLQLYQLQRDQLATMQIEDTKEQLQQQAEETRRIVEDQTEQRKLQIEEEKRRQAELEIEQKFKQLMEEFWYSIDLTWERIFAKQIGKERLLKEDIHRVFEIEEIFCDNEPLRNLEPLSYLVNLKKLSISRTGIYSLQPLRNLSKLEYLDISHNNVRSLNSLSNLENLIELNCSHNEIELLEPIKNNIKMQKMNIANTKIRTLAMISEFRELIEFDFSFTSISSLADLNSRKLEKLAMARTNVANISALSHQSLLVYLDCSYMQITDISSLQNLSNLRYLDLSYTLINTIRPLRNLTNLEVFKISGTTVENITFIENMTQLRELHSNIYYLTGLEPFEKLTNLEYVLVNRNTRTQNFEKTHPRVKLEKKF